MERLRLFLLLLCTAWMPSLLEAQVLVYSEGFETDGEGTRYTTNTYVDCPNSDFFFRTNTNPVTPPTCAQMFGSTLTALQGSFFWASEDIRTSTPVPGSRPPGDITTQLINVSGYSTLTVSLYLATSNNNGGRWESSDSLNIHASLDGGAFFPVGRFMGKGTAAVGARLGIDGNLDGTITGADPVTNCDTVAFLRHTFSIPGTATNLRIKLDFDQMGGTEELAIDQIEIMGVLSPCAPPTINCPGPQTLQLNSNCLANIPNYTSLGVMTGNCSPTASQIPGTGTLMSGPSSLTVSLIATNTASQTDTCTFTVTAEDVMAPQAACQNITAYLDATGNVNVTAGEIDNGSTDNCAITAMSLDFSSYTCSDVGPQGVVLTVRDSSGNADTCMATVTVMDTLAPTVSCTNDTVYLDQQGGALLNLGAITGPNGDNCGTPSLSANPTSFTTNDIGTNLVTLTATDASGNTASCQAVVVVVDTFGTSVSAPVDGLRFTVAPNPTDGRVQVVVECAACLTGGQFQLRLWSMTGQVLHAEELMDGVQYQAIELDLTGLAAGNYFVSLEWEGSVLLRRVVRK